MKLIRITRAPTACQVLSSETSDMPTESSQISEKTEICAVFSDAGDESGSHARPSDPMRGPDKKNRGEYEGISSRKRKGPTMC